MSTGDSLGLSGDRMSDLQIHAKIQSGGLLMRHLHIYVTYTAAYVAKMMMEANISHTETFNRDYILTNLLPKNKYTSACIFLKLTFNRLILLTPEV